MSIVSGTVGAILGSKAQRKATEENRRAAEALNALNYRMFQEGRGSAGNAVLPLYFGGLEKNLSTDAGNYYQSLQSLLGSPAEQARRYQAAVDEFRPAIDASTGTLNDIYNGNLTNARLGYAAPVAAARTGVARAQKQGVLEALQERINALNAGEARKGYSGTGSFAQNRLLGATIGARQGAAGALAGANLANAEDVRNIYDQGQSARLAYMDLPYQRAQQALNLEMLPLNQVQANFSRSLQPFEFFRIGTGAFQAQPLPLEAPSTLGPAIANGIGNFNMGLANIFANRGANTQFGNQQLANSFVNQYAGSGSVPSNFYTLSPAQQAGYAQAFNAALPYQGLYE